MVLEILRNLYYRPMQPIADIANSLSRSIPSVTKQINELLSKNIVVEKGYAASTGGRKAMQYMINEDLSINSIQQLPYQTLKGILSQR